MASPSIYLSLDFVVQVFPTFTAWIALPVLEKGFFRIEVFSASLLSAGVQSPRAFIEEDVLPLSWLKIILVYWTSSLAIEFLDALETYGGSKVRFQSGGTHKVLPRTPDFT